MYPSIEQYLAYPYIKRRTLATVKVICYDLNSFVAWWERTRQRTSDPLLLQYEDLRDWRMLRDRGLASLRGYCFCALACRLLIEHLVTEVKHVSTETLAPQSLPAHAIAAMLRALRAEHNAILRAGV